MLEVTTAVRRAIHAKSLKDLEQAMEQAAFLPIIAGCRKLVLDGVTSAEEVNRVHLEDMDKYFGTVMTAGQFSDRLKEDG